MSDITDLILSMLKAGCLVTGEAKFSMQPGTPNWRDDVLKRFTAGKPWDFQVFRESAVTADEALKQLFIEHGFDNAAAEQLVTAIPISADTDQQTCERLHYEHQEMVPMWVIYGPGTRNYEGRWMARARVTFPADEPTSTIILAESLEQIRARLPRGLTCLQRSPGDSPNIIEIWL